jgi:hypothetical protein
VERHRSKLLCGLWIERRDVRSMASGTELARRRSEVLRCVCCSKLCWSSASRREALEAGQGMGVVVTQRTSDAMDMYCNPRKVGLDRWGADEANDLGAEGLEDSRGNCNWLSIPSTAPQLHMYIPGWPAYRQSLHAVIARPHIAVAGLRTPVRRHLGPRVLSGYEACPRVMP